MACSRSRAGLPTTCLVTTTRELLVVGLAIVVVAAGGATAARSVPSAPPDPTAVAYYTAHQDAVYRIAAAVEFVHYRTLQLRKTHSQATLAQLFAAIAKGRSDITRYRVMITPNSSHGALAAAEGDLVAGAGRLYDALSVLRVHYDVPTTSTSKRFLSQYAEAAMEWNAGARFISSLAQKGTLPVVPVSL